MTGYVGNLDLREKPYNDDDREKILEKIAVTQKDLEEMPLIFDTPDAFLINRRE